MADGKGVTLSELIKSTSEELKKAQVDPANAVMQFEKCELELAVSVRGDANGGIRFWVLEAGAKVSGETVSKVKVSFAPVPGKAATAFEAKPPVTGGKKHGAKG